MEDDNRAGVMSFFVMTFLGMAPFGSLLAGGLASRIRRNSRRTACPGPYVSSARRSSPAGCLRLRKLIRPIYEHIGILPDVTSGIPSVAEWTESAKE